MFRPAGDAQCLGPRPARLRRKHVRSGVVRRRRRAPDPSPLYPRISPAERRRRPSEVGGGRSGASTLGTPTRKTVKQTGTV